MAAGKDLLFHYIDTAAAARQEATVDATKDQQSRAWKSWQAFLLNIGLTKSMYLEGFDSFQKNIIMSAFAQAVRAGAFSPRHNKQLVKGTVNTTVSYVHDSMMLVHDMCV